VYCLYRSKSKEKDDQVNICLNLNFQGSVQTGFIVYLKLQVLFKK